MALPFGAEGLDRRIAELERQVALLMADLAQRNAPPVAYDPETETDPLIKEHVYLDWRGRPFLRQGEASVRGVLIELLAGGDGLQEAQRAFPGLTPEAVRAALRFHERYPGESGYNPE